MNKHLKRFFIMESICTIFGTAISAIAAICLYSKEKDDFEPFKQLSDTLKQLKALGA